VCSPRLPHAAPARTSAHQRLVRVWRALYDPCFWCVCVCVCVCVVCVCVCVCVWACVHMTLPNSFRHWFRQCSEWSVNFGFLLMFFQWSLHWFFPFWSTYLPLSSDKLSLLTHIHSLSRTLSLSNSLSLSRSLTPTLSPSLRLVLSSNSFS
jgi:hypothetical protein